MLIKQRGEQLCGIQRLQQVMCCRREETGLRDIGIFRLGLCTLQREHRIFKLRGAVCHPLLQQLLGFDQRVLS